MEVKRGGGGEKFAKSHKEVMNFKEELKICFTLNQLKGVRWWCDVTCGPDTHTHTHTHTGGGGIYKPTLFLFSFILHTSFDQDTSLALNLK